jgi:hypothetical protein
MPWERNLREKQATGKKGGTNFRYHKHNPWKRRNGDRPVSYSEQTALGREQCNMHPALGNDHQTCNIDAFNNGRTAERCFMLVFAEKL